MVAFDNIWNSCRFTVSKDFRKKKKEKDLVVKCFTALGVGIWCAHSDWSGGRVANPFSARYNSIVTMRLSLGHERRQLRRTPVVFLYSGTFLCVCVFPQSRLYISGRVGGCRMRSCLLNSWREPGQQRLAYTVADHLEQIITLVIQQETPFRSLSLYLNGYDLLPRFMTTIYSLHTELSVCVSIFISSPPYTHLQLTAVGTAKQMKCHRRLLLARYSGEVDERLFCPVGKASFPASTLSIKKKNELVKKYLRTRHFIFTNHHFLVFIWFGYTVKGACDEINIPRLYRERKVCVCCVPGESGYGNNSCRVCVCAPSQGRCESVVRGEWNLIGRHLSKGQRQRSWESVTAAQNLMIMMIFLEKRCGRI